MLQVTVVMVGKTRQKFIQEGLAFYQKRLQPFLHLALKSVKFNFLATIRNIGYTLLVALVLVLIIWFLNWLFRKIFRYAEAHKVKLFRSIKINEYEFLTAEREYKVAVGLLKVIKIGLIVLFFIIALPVIFSIFPSTEGITRKIIGLIWSPVRNILLAVVNYIPELITIIIIYLIFKYLIRFIRFLSSEVENKVLVLPGFYPEWAKPTYNIIRILLYAFMFVVIFPYLPGSDSPVFRGVSVFLGVLFSLGVIHQLTGLVKEDGFLREVKHATVFLIFDGGGLFVGWQNLAVGLSFIQSRYFTDGFPASDL